MIAIVPVREGVLPAGADEAIAECGGRVLLMGSGLDAIVPEGLAREVYRAEVGPLEAGRWARLAPALLAGIPDSDRVVLPNSPDGRDLAPRLAAELDRPLFAGATTITEHAIHVARGGGLELHRFHAEGAFVATLQPGIRGTEPFAADAVTVDLDLPLPDASGRSTTGRPTDEHPGAAFDATVVEVLPPDVRTMDLAEARRIVGGGAGLESAERFEQLDRFAQAIGGVLGATRVITDRGWVDHEHQIGTTGVVVDPSLYVSFGVSGAVQHTSGLGSPDHIVSVNTDAHCPMMAMSDLAIVSDANETLDHLLAILDETGTVESGTVQTGATAATT